MSKFKIGDRVCSKHSMQFHRVHCPGTVIGIKGTGSDKRYLVQRDGETETPTYGSPARNLVLISDIDKWNHADRIRYAGWLAKNKPSLVLPLV